LKKEPHAQEKRSELQRGFEEDQPIGYHSCQGDRAEECRLTKAVYEGESLPTGRVAVVSRGKSRHGVDEVSGRYREERKERERKHR
jgi:hypothetical protein